MADNSSSEVTITFNEKKSVYECKYNGITVYLYLPENTSGTIDAQLSYPGASCYNDSPTDKMMGDYYVSNNPESASLFISTPKYQDSETLKRIISEIETKLNVDLNIDSISGHSAGGMSSLNSFAELIKDDNQGSIALTLYDPANMNYDSINKNEIITNMVKNGSSIRVFGLNHNLKSYKDNSFYNDAIRNGIPMVFIKVPSSNKLTHGSMVGYTTKDGWTAYFDGTIEIDKINDRGYTISMPSFDVNGDIKWNTYNLSDLQEYYNDCFRFSEEEQQELAEALKYLQSTRVQVDYDYLAQASSLATTAGNIQTACEGVAAFSVEGSSKLLPTEQTLISKIYSNNTSLLGFLKSSTADINAAGESYKDTEMHLARAARDIEERL